jgi:hypothetical protein
MKGYAYLDIDGKVVYKPQDYIEEVNPAFFSQNSNFIVRKWKFDTESYSSMETMLAAFADLNLSPSAVHNFLQSIDFSREHFKKLKEDVNKV